MKPFVLPREQKTPCRFRVRGGWNKARKKGTEKEKKVQTKLFLLEGGSRRRIQRDSE